MNPIIYLVGGLSAGYVTLIVSSFSPALAVLLSASIVILILTKSDMLKNHLAFAFSAGIIVDIANQNRFPLEAMFLLALVLASEFLRSRFIELSSKLISSIYYLIVSLLYISVYYLFYYHAINTAGFLYSMSAGLVTFFVVLIIKESYKVRL